MIKRFFISGIAHIMIYMFILLLWFTNILFKINLYILSLAIDTNFNFYSICHILISDLYLFHTMSWVVFFFPPLPLEELFIIIITISIKYMFNST